MLRANKKEVCPVKHWKTRLPTILLAALSLALILSLPLLMDAIAAGSLSQPGTQAKAAGEPAPIAPGTFTITTKPPEQWGGVVVAAPDAVLTMTDTEDRLSVLYKNPQGESIDISTHARGLLGQLTGLDFFETVDGQPRWLPSIRVTPYPGGLQFVLYFAEPAVEARMMDPEGGLSTNYQLTLWADEKAGQPLVVEGFSAFTGPIGESFMRAASLGESGASDMDKLQEMALEQGGDALKALIDTAAEQHQQLAGQVFTGLKLNGQTFQITHYNTVSLTHNRPSNNRAPFTAVELYLELQDSRGQPFMATVRVNPDLSTNLTSLYATGEEARKRN